MTHIISLRGLFTVQRNGWLNKNVASCFMLLNPAPHLKCRERVKKKVYKEKMYSVD